MFQKGATPKDGPSLYCVAMLLLLSGFSATKIPVKASVAMTGEIYASRRGYP